MKKYDLIIIGGGPAGLTAGIYAGRYRLDTLIISKTRGGLAATAYKVCNFPSYEEVRGFELMQKMINQVEKLGVPIIYEEVKEINEKNKEFIVKTDKKEYFADKIIFATGTKRLRLNVKGEGKFLGRGVSYCATCDAFFFKDKIVSVIGGSNAALTTALLLSEYSSKVYIIYRGNKFFKAEQFWVDLVKKNKKIEIIFNEEIEEIIGDKNVEKIKLKSGRLLNMNGIFVETGSVPETIEIASLKVKHTLGGYIITDKNQKTNIEGFYAAGDVTENPLKQIITASAEGAVAAFNIYKDVKKEVKNE